MKTMIRLYCFAFVFDSRKFVWNRATNLMQHANRLSYDRLMDLVNIRCLSDVLP